MNIPDISAWKGGLGFHFTCTKTNKKTQDKQKDTQDKQKDTQDKEKTHKTRKRLPKYQLNTNKPD